MDIAEEYFERLLGSADPIKAVTELDQVWCSRPGVALGVPRLGLAEPEYDIHLILVYTGAVINGGHAQFFEGPLASFAGDTVAALKRVSLTSLADILELAASRQIGLHIADKQVDPQLFAVDSALLRYARAHASELCRPERGG